MAQGEAAKQVFGEETVSKFASAGAANVSRHLASVDFLAAAFSAAHVVRLTGRTEWSAEDQEHMSLHLSEEVRLALSAGHDQNAASRASTYVMLTDQNPWTGEELERLQKALGSIPDQDHPYESASVAEEKANYLLLGGAIFWSEAEFHEMRTAIIADFQHAAERGDEILATARLADFDVMEASLEAFTMTG